MVCGLVGFGGFAGFVGFIMVCGFVGLLGLLGLWVCWVCLLCLLSCSFFCVQLHVGLRGGDVVLVVFALQQCFCSAQPYVYELGHFKC